MNLDPTVFKAAARAAMADPNLKPALARLKTHFSVGR
jgi:hypothetical protein